MATIVKRGIGWRAQVRRRGYKPVSATFDTKRDAEMWAAEVEAKMPLYTTIFLILDFQDQNYPSILGSDQVRRP